MFWSMYGTKSLEVSDVLNIGVVAYFCHHLTDNYFDLSDLYVDLSVNNVDLSDHYIWY